MADKIEQMNAEERECSHINIVRETEYPEDGKAFSFWFCNDCDETFYPEAHLTARGESERAKALREVIELVEGQAFPLDGRLRRKPLIKAIEKLMEADGS